MCGDGRPLFFSFHFCFCILYFISCFVFFLLWIIQVFHKKTYLKKHTKLQNVRGLKKCSLFQKMFVITKCLRIQKIFAILNLCSHIQNMFTISEKKNWELKNFYDLEKMFAYSKNARQFETRSWFFTKIQKNSRKLYKFQTKFINSKMFMSSKIFVKKIWWLAKTVPEFQKMFVDSKIIHDSKKWSWVSKTCSQIKKKFMIL